MKKKNNNTQFDTPQEVKFQIALGTLPTAPSVLAKFVKNTDSVELLVWASYHKHSKVRGAAARNPLLPTSDFLRLALFDRTKGVLDLVHSTIDSDDKRRASMQRAVDFFKCDCIQLELAFGDE